TVADQDRSQLIALEAAIDKALPAIEAMKAAGQALGEIRQRQLYRLSSPTWEGYVTDRFAMSVRRADQLIAFGVVHQEVEAAADHFGTAVPELSERAVRPLVGMDPATIEEVVAEAAAAPGGISSASIRAAAGRRRPARRGVPRPVRILVPGGVVVVEISRKGAANGTTVVSAIEAALKKLGDQGNREAA
ncbi:MAG: hypothetical protein EBZ59_09080, partial [Planctomycetia bacterium]|nr:hypothetical protein [Planctomycetia bacterium]